MVYTILEGGILHILNTEQCSRCHADICHKMAEIVLLGGDNCLFVWGEGLLSVCMLFSQVSMCRAPIMVVRLSCSKCVCMSCTECVCICHTLRSACGVYQGWLCGSCSKCEDICSRRVSCNVRHLSMLNSWCDRIISTSCVCQLID